MHFVSCDETPDGKDILSPDEPPTDSNCFLPVPSFFSTFSGDLGTISRRIGNPRERCVDSVSGGVCIIFAVSIENLLAFHVYKETIDYCLHK